MVIFGIAEVLLLLLLLAIIVAAVRNFGAAAVLKGVLLLTFSFALLAVPFGFFFLSAKQSATIYHTYEDKVSGVDREATVFIEPQQAPEAIVTQMPTVTHTPVAPLAPQSPQSSAGDVIGQSELWTDSYTKDFVADVYSSKIEAAKSIARRCVPLITQAADKRSSKTRVYFEANPRNFVNPGESEDVTVAFKEEIRRAIPNVSFVGELQTEVVELQLNRRGRTESNPLQSYSLVLTLDGNEHDIVAKFVDKPWVRNDVEFRLSPDTPKHYVVALGDSTEGGTSAIEEATQHFMNDVEYVLTNGSHNWGSSSARFPALAQVAATSLIRDKFVQQFTTKLDGSLAEMPFTREAILIDCTPQLLQNAIVAAKTGRSFTPQFETTSSASMHASHSSRPRRNSPDAEGYTTMAGFLLGCCGILKGISWFFDRKDAVSS